MGPLMIVPLQVNSPFKSHYVHGNRTLRHVGTPNTHFGYITFLSDTLHVILEQKRLFSSYGNFVCLTLKSEARFLPPTNKVAGR